MLPVIAVTDDARALWHQANDQELTTVPPAAEWRIRPARPSDRAFILGLLPRLAEGFELPSWRTRAEVVRAEAATMERALSELHEDPDRAPLLLAESPAGVPGGFVFLERHVDYFRGAPHAHIAVLAVAEEVQGLGAGRALLTAAETWAREQGMALLTLNVFDGNARARRVYQRNGFAPETLRYVKAV